MINIPQIQFMVNHRQYTKLFSSHRTQNGNVVCSGQFFHQSYVFGHGNAFSTCILYTANKFYHSQLSPSQNNILHLLIGIFLFGSTRSLVLLGVLKLKWHKKKIKEKRKENKIGKLVKLFQKYFFFSFNFKQMNQINLYQHSFMNASLLVHRLSFIILKNYFLLFFHRFFFSTIQRFIQIHFQTKRK